MLFLYLLDFAGQLNIVAGDSAISHVQQKADDDNNGERDSLVLPRPQHHIQYDVFKVVGKNGLRLVGH